MKNKIITLLVIILVALAVATFFYFNQNESNKTIPLPTFINTKRNTTINTYSAWVPYWKEDQAINSIQSIKKGVLSEVNPVWYELDADGKITISKDNDKTSFINATASKKIKIVPTITNATAAGFDSQRVSKMINDSEDSVSNFVDIAIKNNYSGWDLDLEEVSAKDKTKYNEFINLLADKLHKNKLTLSVTVHAQTGKDDWNGTKGQDLESIGNSADFVRVMAYDYHNTESEAGPITPTSYLIDTIKYTKEKIETKKIVMCLPTYGYDWAKKVVTPLQYEDANNLVEKENISVKRDEESFELTGEYQKDNVLHTVWYQDAETVLQKVKIINQQNITNICFWHLGGEDQDIWLKI